jgi:hypothetical protein
MARRYRVKNRLSGDVSRPLRYWTAMRRWRDINKPRGPQWRLWKVGDPDGPIDPDFDKRNLGWEAFMTASRNRLKTAPIGTEFHARGEQDDRIAWVRIIEVSIIRPIDTSGTAYIDLIGGALNGLFRGWENWGICVCKRVAGTWSYSDHSYCAAIDIHHTKAKMAEMANYFARNAGKYHIAYLIYARQKFVPGSGWSYYSGINPHYDHVHISVQHGPDKLAC